MNNGYLDNIKITINCINVQLYFNKYITAGQFNKCTNDIIR